MAELLEVPSDESIKRELEVNKKLHPRMWVTPLKEGEFVKYRLYKSDQDDITRTEESSGKKLKHQQVYSLVGAKKIYDPFYKKPVVIENVTGFKHTKDDSGEVKRNSDGRAIRIPIIERILFPRTGELILTDRDNETYAFMERINENGSNEFRDPKAPKAIFYRVDVKRQAMKELEKDYIMVDALNWVRDADGIEIKTIYKALDDGSRKNLNADSDEQLKKGIFNLAKNNPILVLKSSTNRLAKLKVQCMEAENYRIIAFNEMNGERTWIYVQGTPEIICQVEPGIHKIDALVKFFTSPDKGKDGEPIGKAWYTKVIEGLKQVLDYKR